MATQDGGIADLESTIQSEENRQLSCPICDRSGDDVDEIYRHLMVNHRKSELSRGLLALVTMDHTSIAESDKEPEPLSGDTLV